MFPQQELPVCFREINLDSQKGQVLPCVALRVPAGEETDPLTAALAVGRGRQEEDARCTCDSVSALIGNKAEQNCGGT